MIQLLGLQIKKRKLTNFLFNKKLWTSTDSIMDVLPLTGACKKTYGIKDVFSIPSLPLKETPSFLISLSKKTEVCESPVIEVWYIQRQWRSIMEDLTRDRLWQAGRGEWRITPELSAICSMYPHQGDTVERGCHDFIWSEVRNNECFLILKLINFTPSSLQADPGTLTEWQYRGMCTFTLRCFLKKSQK